MFMGYFVHGLSCTWHGTGVFRPVGGMGIVLQLLSKVSPHFLNDQEESKCVEKLSGSKVVLVKDWQLSIVLKKIF